jgi:Antibiotic biosynthesis monooxygenase
MIVVVGRVRTNADKRDALVRIGQAVAAESRTETGCLSYRLYEDTERENEFVFVEEWASSERYSSTSRPLMSESSCRRFRRRSLPRRTSSSTRSRARWTWPTSGPADNGR